MTITNWSFNIHKETSVILHEDKYVFINSVDLFSGEVFKGEESKEVEPFLKTLIEENEPSSLFSAYLPEQVEYYTIIFELEDLEKLTISDLLISKNVDDKEVLQNLLNEGYERYLRDVETWEILQKPSHEKAKIINKNVSVSVDIGANLILK